MSDTDDTTAETTEELSDKDTNFRALKEKSQARETELLAELEKLRPLHNEKMLREAGYDPDSDRGIAIVFAIKAGEVEATAEGIGEFASSRGWDATPVLTETEAEQVSSAAQVRQIQTASVSDSPVDIAQQVSEAEADGNHRLARHLKNQVLQAQMVAKSNG